MYNAKSIYIKLSTTHDLIIFLTPGILLGQLAAVAAISCLNIWSSVFLLIKESSILIGPMVVRSQQELPCGCAGSQTVAMQLVVKCAASQTAAHGLYKLCVI